MFFDKEFIASVEEDPITGIVTACDMTLHELSGLETQDGWNDDEHDLLWEAASFVELIIDSNGLDIDVVLPSASGDLSANCQKLLEYLNGIKEKFDEHALNLKIDSYQNRYRSILKGSFAYEFSQGDLERIQTLVSELREHITQNTFLENDHKQRLLKRLERLQSELHKRVSDLDRFWGLVGDAGVVLGKLGTDSKPIVDRIRELAEIVWKTQARTEELPSDLSNPVLEHNDMD